MCGVIAVIKKKNDGIATATAIEGMLTNQIHRGTQGFGYVAFDDEIKAYVRRENRSEIESVLAKNDARSIMFHHRIPTSTPNYADCAHPIRVSHEELTFDYYLEHNGMISNDSILRESHLALGYEYTTEIENTTKTKNAKRSSIEWNDSEALAIDVARFIEAKQDKLESRGSIAFICLQVEKGTNNVKRVFYGRNTSPLTYNLTKNALVLRSEGEKEMVKPNMLYSLDVKKWIIEETDVKIGEIGSTRNWTSGIGGLIDDEDETPNTQLRLPSPRSYYGGRDVDEYGDCYGCDENGYPIGINNTEDEAAVAEFTKQTIQSLEQELDKLDADMENICDDIEYAENSGDIQIVSELKEKLNQIQDNMESIEIDIELYREGTLTP